jgi:chromosome segregation ATPase
MTDQAAGAAISDDPAEAGTLDGEEQAQAELDPVALKRQLAEKDEYIAKLTGSQGSLLQKLDQTAERVIQLEGRLGEQRDLLTANRQEPQQPEKNPWELADADREQFQNSPDKIVEFTRDRFVEQERKINGLVKQIADLLETRDGSIEQRFTSLRQEILKADPERQAFQGAVEELKKDPELADLPDEKLIAIAKRANMKPDYEFTGGPSGRPAQSTRQSSGDRRSQSEIHAGFMAIYGDEKRAAKATANYMAKQKGGVR